MSRDQSKKIRQEIIKHPGQFYARQRSAFEEMHTNQYAGTWTQAENHIVAVCLIPQGDDIVNRSGRKVVVRHINVRAQMINKRGQSVNGGVIRMTVLYDKTPCGALAGVADFNNYGTGKYSNGAIPNITAGDRFKVLYDEVKTLGGILEGVNELSGVGPQVANFIANIPCRLLQNYTTSGYTQADLSIGNIIVAFSSDADHAWDGQMSTICYFDH